MKRIYYQIKNETKTDGAAISGSVIVDKSIPYTAANYQLALTEAYEGKVEITDDGQPEPGPTIAERMDSLEAAIERGLTL